MNKEAYFRIYVNEVTCLQEKKNDVMLRFTTSKRCLQFFLQNRIPVRGNPHILVVGDPGLGKSQVIGIDAGLINLLSFVFCTNLFPLKFEMSAWYFAKLKAGFHQC